MISNERREKRIKRWIKVGFLCIIGGGIIGGATNFAVGLILSLVCFFGCLLCAMGDVLVSEEDKLIEFYEVCLSKGIKNLYGIENRKRAELIATEVGLKDGTIDDYYKQGEEYVKKIKEKEEKAAYNEFKRKEKENYNYITKYANMEGNSKTIAMLNDRISSIVNSNSEAEKRRRNLSNAFLEKEKDWAIHGGIASAIGGDAIGVVTALNVQAENAEIRARNAETKKMISDMTRRDFVPQSSIDAIRAEIETEKLKLVGDIPAEELLSHLTFKPSEITVSKTGAISINTKAVMDKKLTIYNNLPARINGTVVAKISNNNREIGKALLVFPLRGVSYTKEIFLNGMLLEGGEQGKSYTVEFTATNLYAIEC